jgi:hypothetical protein
VVHLYAAFGEELFGVAVGQPGAQVPADCDRDYLWWEPEPGEAGPRQGPGDTRTADGSILPDLWSVNATEPFATLRRRLGDAFEVIELDSSPGNAAGFGRPAHSVLTREVRETPGHPTLAARTR